MHRQFNTPEMLWKHSCTVYLGKNNTCIRIRQSVLCVPRVPIVIISLYSFFWLIPGWFETSMILIHRLSSLVQAVRVKCVTWLSLKQSFQFLHFLCSLWTLLLYYLLKKSETDFGIKWNSLCFEGFEMLCLVIIIDHRPLLSAYQWHCFHRQPEKIMEFIHCIFQPWKSNKGKNK